jgi:peptide-methionine (R)-S-oxide reductase
MERRTLLQTLLALIATPALITRASSAIAATPDFPPLAKTKDEWQTLLEPARFRVLFEEDTERPFSSALNDEKRAGTFVCAACFLPLFTSNHKYESHTGWPSFTQPIAGHMDTKRDFKLVLPRTEYHCARCTGHQGHVFNDGPAPRGERWCNNGLALIFVAQGETLPSLRS